MIALVSVAFAVVSCNSPKQSVQQPTGNDMQNIQINDKKGISAAASGQITMTLEGCESTIVLAGEKYLESGCHAIDKNDGDISSSITVEGNVDASKPGTYTVTYTATNSSGQQATAQRTVTVKSKMAKNTSGISVLMYHYIYTSKDKPDQLNANYLSASKFEAQLKWLTQEGYYFPSYKELEAYVKGTHSLPKKSVVLTFDDGELGFLKHGIPLLEKYKVPATSFIICDRSFSKKRVLKYASPYCNFQSHTYGLHNPGHTAKGHGGKIWDLSKKEITADLRKAQKMLGTTEAVAWPYGDVSDVAPAAAKDAGVLCAFSTEYGQVQKGMNTGKLPRIRVFGSNSLSSFKYQVINGA